MINDDWIKGICTLLICLVSCIAVSQPMRLKGCPANLPDLPTLFVTTTDRLYPTKSVATGETEAGSIRYITGNEYKTASAVITFRGDTLVKTGEYSDTTGCRIKIRGNTSALDNFPSYKIKFTQKTDPFDFGYEKKAWILLKSKPSWGSRLYLLDEIVGYRVAMLCDMKWQPQNRIVNLVVNGDFRGFHILCDPVERDGKRVDISKQGFIIENDPYWLAEPVWFRTDYRSAQTIMDCRYTFKYPDADDITPDSVADVQTYMNNIESIILDQKPEVFEYIDKHTFAASLLALDILGMKDIPGSNIFYYRKKADTKLKRGPLWDFDSVCALSEEWTNCHMLDYTYDRYLLKHEEFVDEYISIWNSIRDSLLINIEQEMENVRKNYGPAIKESATFDYKYCGFFLQDIDKEIESKREWFRNRIKWIDDNIASLRNNIVTEKGYYDYTWKLKDNPDSLLNMPAGHYTMLAQVYAEEGATAHMRLGNDSIIVRSPKNGAYYYMDAEHCMNEMLCGKGYPGNTETIHESFALGHYWNVISFDLPSDTTLHYSFSIEHDGQNYYRFIYDNVKLFYGEMPGTVVPVNASAGTDVPLCLPCDLKSGIYGQVFLPLGYKNGYMMMHPVDSVCANQPFVLRLATDLKEINIPYDKTIPDGGDIIPLKWGTGDIRRDSGFSWYMTDDEGNTIKAGNMRFAEPDYLNMDFDVNIENQTARRYLATTFYTFGAETVIDDFKCGAPVRRDWPNSVYLPLPAGYNANDVKVRCSNSKSGLSAQVYHAFDGYYVLNTRPGEEYRFTISTDDTDIASGTFNTVGTTRMIWGAWLLNARDMGGWHTHDGKRIKYGKLFRGAEVLKKDMYYELEKQCLMNIGVKAELDLRRDEDGATGLSELGFSADDMTYFYANTYDFTPADLLEPETWERQREQFRFILHNLNNERPVYFHCAWGADRTGMMAMLLEGLLGVTYDEMCKDYELTGLSGSGVRRKSMLDEWLKALGVQHEEDVATCVENYFTQKIGVTADEISQFRMHMIDDEGHTTDISHATDVRHRMDFYNLMGMPVTPTYRGIVIYKGRKIVR